MARNLRNLLLIISAVQLFFAIAYFFRFPLATRWWPLEGTTPLTFILLASFFAAAAASTIWAVTSGIEGALAGIALDYVTIMGPLSILAFQRAASGGGSGMLSFAVTCLLAAFFGLGLLWRSARVPVASTIPTPPLVRWSFLLFIVALLLTSARLLLRVPNTIP